MLSMLAMMAVLWGGQLVYNSQAVQAPLRTAYRDIPAVRDVQMLTASDGTVVVRVRLGLVSNLLETYRSIEARTAHVLGSRRFRVVPLDRRNAALTQDFYAVNDILQQGIATGQFVPMAAQFTAATRKLGLQRSSVVVGSRYLYVTLVKDSSTYLYQLVPRHVASAAAAGTGNAS
jgi:hypothetical protein